MNAFARAAQASFAALKTVAGVPIVYRCAGSGPAIRLIAVRGKPAAPVNDTDGGMIRVEALAEDWIVAAADLRGGDFSRQPFTPTEGDTITAVLEMPGSPGATFQVTSPPFTPSDQSGTRLRIHTKRITN
jgi:hypothetical protein